MAKLKTISELENLKAEAKRKEKDILAKVKEKEREVFTQIGEKAVAYINGKIDKSELEKVIKIVGLFKKVNEEVEKRERVQFDYNYSAWMKVHPFKKKVRYNFIQVYLNNMIGKATYVLNFSNRLYATPVTQVLAQHIGTGSYKKMATISFHRAFLLENIGQNKLDKLKKMGHKYEKIISTSKGVSARIKKLKIDENSLRIYNKFFIVEMEEKRNIFDGKWKFFKDVE